MLLLSLFERISEGNAAPTPKPNRGRKSLKSSTMTSSQNRYDLQKKAN